MKKTFIIECDSDMDTIFLYEAGNPIYEVSRDRWIVIRGEKIINSHPDAKFYGILDSLLITSSRVRSRFSNVLPIIPEPPPALQRLDATAGVDDAPEDQRCSDPADTSAHGRPGWNG